MSIQEKLTAEMKTAMKAKDTLRLNTIRMMRTAIKNREIEEKGELSDDAVIGVLSTLVKQRRESAQAFRENDRVEMAEKEEQEIIVIQDFLPAQLSEDEVKAMIAEAASETGASSMKDMGKVMKIVSAKTRGRADGKVVSELVKAHLSG